MKIMKHIVSKIFLSLILIFPLCLKAEEPRVNKAQIKRILKRNLTPILIDSRRKPSYLDDYVSVSESYGTKIKYYKKEDSKNKFPTAKKITSKDLLKALSSKSEMSVNQIKASTTKIVNQQLNRSFTLKKLPDCKKLTVTALPAKIGGNQTGFFDIVFYDPNDKAQVLYTKRLKNSIKVPYVAGTKIGLNYKTTSSFNSPRAVMAEFLGLSCLPGRVYKIKLKYNSFILREEGIRPELPKESKKKLIKALKELKKENNKTR